MPRDNVTPFRPRRPPPKPVQRGGGLKSHRGKAVLGHLLTLAAFALSFVFAAAPLSYVAMAAAIAAAAFAYANRTDAMPWAATHHEYMFRTLLVGYSIWVLSGLLPLIFAPLAIVTLLAHIGVLAGAVLRSGVGLGLAVFRKPISNPRGWFI